MFCIIHLKITSCKTIEQIFLKNEQKCLAGGDEYGNICMIKENIKKLKKLQKTAK